MHLQLDHYDPDTGHTVPSTAQLGFEADESGVSMTFGLPEDKDGELGGCYIERRPHGWELFVHRDLGAEPVLRIAIPDVGELAYQHISPGS